MSVARFLVALALFATIDQAVARPLAPAEKRDSPYSGIVPPCQDPILLSEIQSHFAQSEGEYWHSGLTIAAFEEVHEIGFRSNGLDYIPRRYCAATVLMNNQQIRTVDYSIVESGGSIGFDDGVVFLRRRLDRNNAYAPGCKMARPLIVTPRVFRLALALSVVGTSLPVRADDCLLDHCEDRQAPSPPRAGQGGNDNFRRNGSGPRGASRPGQFDFYVLSLSWSPGFCATGGADKGRDQCRAGADIGFTVHGLWPQYDRGYPSDCNGNRSPPRAALAQTDGVYPDQGLARYEWRKHGTCSGLDPFAYFAAAKAARDAVTIPPQFKDPHEARTLAPPDVVRAFTDANPRLRPGMLAAICEHGTLDEVRICFSRDLKGFQTCPEVVREGCRSGTVAMPGVR